MMVSWAPPKQLTMMVAGLLVVAMAVAPAAVAQQPSTAQPTSGTSSTTVQMDPFDGLDVR
jgi:hypothetical protein